MTNGNGFLEPTTSPAKLLLALLMGMFAAVLAVMAPVTSIAVVDDRLVVDRGGFGAYEHGVLLRSQAVGTELVHHSEPGSGVMRVTWESLVVRRRDGGAFPVVEKSDASVKHLVDNWLASRPSSVGPLVRETEQTELARSFAMFLAFFAAVFGLMGFMDVSRSPDIKKG